MPSIRAGRMRRSRRTQIRLEDSRSDDWPLSTTEDIENDDMAHRRRMSGWLGRHIGRLAADCRGRSVPSSIRPDLSATREAFDRPALRTSVSNPAVLVRSPAAWCGRRRLRLQHTIRPGPRAGCRVGRASGEAFALDPAPTFDDIPAARPKHRKLP
jgi:hypothetical protein